MICGLFFQEPYVSLVPISAGLYYVEIIATKLGLQTKSVRSSVCVQLISQTLKSEFVKYFKEKGTKFYTNKSRLDQSRRLSSIAKHWPGKDTELNFWFNLSRRGLIFSWTVILLGISSVTWRSWNEVSRVSYVRESLSDIR